MPIYREILAKLMGFFFDELQHERFEASRPTVMAAAIEVRDMYPPPVTASMILPTDSAQHH